MKRHISLILIIPICLLFSHDLLAQTAANGFWDKWTIPLVLLLFILFIVPYLIKAAGSKPAYAGNENFISLKKGHNIKLKGTAERKVNEIDVSTFSVQPPNFRGIAPIPKVVVNMGDTVKAGEPVFYNKQTPDIQYVAPVSGEVIEITRGKKRAITNIVILADKELQYKQLSALDYQNSSKEDIIQYLLASGFWPHIQSRPYNIVADPSVTPRDIFISTFDTAPLAPDFDLLIEGRERYFQQGLDVLAKLTEGSVHLGLNANGQEAPTEAYSKAQNVKKHYFTGKHPAGNVGIQIHHIKPINAGDIVWTLSVKDVILLGKMITDRIYDPECLVALTGSGIKNPAYVRTRSGAKIADLVKDNLKEDEEMRIISGDVLSGSSKTIDQFLNVYDDQITVIPEGRYNELFGWLLPIKPRPSLSRSLVSGFRKNATYDADTNTHGEKRAFVVTGEYEKLLPANIYPQHLMKAIMTKDFERMEGLGIYELAEEDVALCEFSCTSKMPLQKILREGLDLMYEQG